MQKERDDIEFKMGNNNPFSTPEGYFEHLTDRVMSKLPDTKPEEKPAVIRYLRPLLYAAVFTGVIVLSATFLMKDDQEQETQQMASAPIDSGDAYFDDAADYAMVDNQDIYAYLLADL